jgi:ribosome biogenesis protein ERB1
MTSGNARILFETFLFFYKTSAILAISAMTVDDSRRQSKKRKHVIDEGVEPETFHGAVDLEMPSDEEDQEVLASDDGEVDEFPEIDTGSDSDEDEVGISDTDEEEDSEEEAENDVNSDDSEIHIFPKAKIMVSDITGRPKRVYPEIEPEYDSDSSTEEASLLLFFAPFFINGLFS